MAVENDWKTMELYILFFFDDFDWNACIMVNNMNSWFTTFHLYNIANNIMFQK